MTFSAFQKAAITTAIYPGRGKNLIYPVLGLAGESGEVSEKVKKIIRDDGGEVTTEKREQIAKELGDVLWYVAAICDELRLDMGAVAEGNLAKLAARQARGTLTGSGDNR